MPFYGGTRRTLLGAGLGPVFLPAAGPFASLAPKLASAAPNLTIAGSTVLGSSRRLTPLEYNVLTINSGTVTVSYSDMCVFIRCNVLNLNGGTMNLDGEAGSFTGSGGRGSGGGGGGGGASNASDPCDIFLGGTGGLGTSGNDGMSGPCGCLGPKSGGSGVGRANWGPISDGGTDTYDYVSDLLGAFNTNSHLPYLNAGDGGYGGYSTCNFSYQGGNGGGSAGLLVIAANSILGTGSFGANARGGGAETSGDGTLTAFGGSGGGMLFYSQSYPSTILNGKCKVTKDPFGSYDGSAQIFQINANNSITRKALNTAF